MLSYSEQLSKGLPGIGSSCCAAGSERRHWVSCGAFDKGAVRTHLRSSRKHGERRLGVVYAECCMELVLCVSGKHKVARRRAWSRDVANAVQLHVDGTLENEHHKKVHQTHHITSHVFPHDSCSSAVDNGHHTLHLGLTSPRTS
jgi:hypothetical protein